MKDRAAVAVRDGRDAPGEGERGDVAVGGEAVGGAGDVGGEGGHGDGVEAVTHGTPHISEHSVSWRVRRVKMTYRDSARVT